MASEEERGGKRLLDVPGYRFQALVTSLPAASHPPLAVWRYYNGRADCENVIKELREGFALPTLCLEKFWATEAALSLATLTYNLIVLFQRHLGWQQKVTIHTLRFWLFVTAGVLSHPGGQDHDQTGRARHANATGGGAYGRKFSARYPTAMQ